MEFLPTILALILSGYILFEFFERKKYFQALRATYAWCAAGEALVAWRERNPDTRINLSDAGSVLLIRYIVAYDWFMETHPEYRDNGFRNYLRMLHN